VQSSVWTRRGKGEGLPVALVEALAASQPVVATAMSGIPELVRDGHMGWLVPPDDVRAIPAALQRRSMRRQAPDTRCSATSIVARPS
jgi:glycosyltransferase involved in cell wall biosynthesis